VKISGFSYSKVTPEFLLGATLNEEELEKSKKEEEKNQRIMMRKVLVLPIS
jgi:hypothetical protein